MSPPYHGDPPEDKRPSRWAEIFMAALIPIGMGIAGTVVSVSYAKGQFEQEFKDIDLRFKPLEQYVQTNTTEHDMALFVPRAEWQQQVQGRDKEMASLKELIALGNQKQDRMESKLDHLILELDGTHKGTAQN